MAILTAHLVHQTPNGLGSDPAARPDPTRLQQLQDQRELVSNSLVWFEGLGDEIYNVLHCRERLRQLDAAIAELEGISA